MTRPSDIKNAFLTFARKRGIAPTDLREREAIELFCDFYEGVAFVGRDQHSRDDQLLFQTGNPPGSDQCTINVTRQLYKNGHGVQLGLTWTYDQPSTVAYVTLWSDGKSLEDWTEEAFRALLDIDFDYLAPTDVKLSYDRF